MVLGSLEKVMAHTKWYRYTIATIAGDEIKDQKIRRSRHVRVDKMHETRNSLTIYVPWESSIY